MAINSKKKGSAGERELASLLRGYGFTKVRRTAQFCGNTGEAADLVNLPGIHIECKRVERLDLYGAMKQAERDAREGEIPAVFHRRNRTSWKVTMNLEDFIEIYKEWELHQ